MRRIVLAMLVGLAAAPGARAQERMPPIAPDKMTEAQKKAVTDYKALRGVDMTGPPWTVLLRVPAHVMPALQIRLHYLNNSALPRPPDRVRHPVRRAPMDEQLGVERSFDCGRRGRAQG